MYGKIEAKHNRKMGHVTLFSEMMYDMLVLLFLIVNGELDENNIVVLPFLVLLGVFYRMIILFERTDIKNLDIYIKKSQLLDDDSKKLLIGDIESSLKKIANFAIGVVVF